MRGEYYKKKGDSSSSSRRRSSQIDFLFNFDSVTLSRALSQLMALLVVGIRCAAQAQSLCLSLSLKLMISLLRRMLCSTSF